ncbi:hypothetical protein ARHIZOSPH14_18260 [Agromyces rhizosphaerae]|uniref:DUF4062 domain-containing protein n=1 Tax=Agromyces rhizosphaerae TaxID=88374 RepID=A0A9W6FP28_9MICO|nr:DUF4062 domain-containing protein [Agromyces rhizosphaerae]GLI27584.1 hypothetical protein ARHIZOSPH14_18260 [Agromyces rhizosphaerae]
MASLPVIRTPDQRIRVFVSSTLRELQPERRAVRAAIERLRLAPVMFEQGARPYPPREVYRSYLAQSDVFLGIYGDSYGWVAPGEEISGLEDEYRLAPAHMPKLIYIRRSAAREDRLTELIARIKHDDSAAYLSFDSAEQLEEQVASDLAALLAERFVQSRESEDEPADASIPPVPGLPVPYTTTIGREHEISALREMLADRDGRIVSLIGPGGVGKSRLSIEVAHACDDLFPDGVTFVPLEGVLEPGLLVPTISYALGIRDNGEAALEERVEHALRGRRALVVLDNFEQIVEAAPMLVRLSSAAPTVAFLVTSRVVLRVRGERVFDVPALRAPPEGAPASLDRATRSPAVALFVDRARAAKPDFEVTAENAADLADICRRLEGLPLAIELAAARVRMLGAHGIAQRLEQALPLLSATMRDLPERHRTMRGTIDWSVGLLPDEQRALLYDLGVFATRFTFDAVEAIGAGRAWEADALDAMAALVDGTLVKEVDVGGRSAYSLLAIVREFAIERLREQGGTRLMRAAHADYYRELVARIAPGLRGAGQADAVALLGLELSNLRAAVRHLIYTDRLDDAGDFAWSLLIYWWIAGFFDEVRVWMTELLGKDRPMSAHTHAVARFFVLWCAMWQHPSEEVVDGLGECVEEFTVSGDDDAAAMSLAARATARLQLPNPDIAAAERELRDAATRMHEHGNGWAEAITEVSSGRLAWLRGEIDEAVRHFDRATGLAEAGADLFTLSVSGNHRGRLLLARGDADAAEDAFLRTLHVSVRLHFEEGVAYGLEGLCGVAALRGEAERAGVLAAAAAAIRSRIGIFDVEAFTVHTVSLDAVRTTDPAAVAAGERRGREMTVPEAVTYALPDEDVEEEESTLAHW